MSSERVHALSEEDRKIYETAVEALLTTMESEAGCAILIADAQGDGVATLLAVGNTELVPPLCRTANRIAQQVYSCDEDATLH